MSAKVAVTSIPGGTSAVVIFILTLFSFMVESELTQYVQNSLGYHHPFFILYIVHTTFVIVFPLHLLYLTKTRDQTAASLINDLLAATAQHLAGPGARAQFPRSKLVFFVLALTVGITVPALIWFAAISLASVTDVTAIWNTNAFFAYVITVKVFRLQWQAKRLMAVSLATLGVIAVVYGGSRNSPQSPLTTTESFTGTSASLIGILLTLFGAFCSGLYQVLYKKYAALPSDPDELIVEDGTYTQLPNSEAQSEGEPIDAKDTTCLPPFGLHSTFLTSLMGVCTFLMLWIPIPLLHRTGLEPFALPDTLEKMLAVAGIALSGVTFNGGFMILLGLWGPIVTSVGGLLTIVLVFLSDVTIRGAKEVISFYSVVGCGIIVAAFGVLAHDMYHSR